LLLRRLLLRRLLLRWLLLRRLLLYRSLLCEVVHPRLTLRCVLLLRLERLRVLSADDALKERGARVALPRGVMDEKAEC
tara:strand:+ start:701 stop:937 length:237 start_codon:yes stop_codon:yes gene_type:complete